MTQYLIIGSGIEGLCTAYVLKEKFPNAEITIIEKESDVAAHASGRNSGVLHAGFYYSADSLKAKFCVKGNEWMKAYCQKNNLPINACGKLVVAKNESELKGLYELEKRGQKNGCEVSLIDQSEVSKIDANIKTYQKALFSPKTSSVDPKAICFCLKNELMQKGVQFLFNTQYLGKTDQAIKTNKGLMAYTHLINCAGLYADKIAHDFGIGKKYTMLPFKGIYLKYSGQKMKLKTHVYPVPDLKKPFLGVHFTNTVDGHLKIGPTAIPAFWRENYQGLSRFKFSEFASIGFFEALLFLSNRFGFRDLALDEIKKYKKSYLVRLASQLVNEMDTAGFKEFTVPGIRAQLFDKQKKELVQDFLVESGESSTHILNAVSPGLTCAYPFAEYVVNQYLK